MTTIVVHYDEIGLKGRQRSYFTRRLAQNLRALCPALATVPVDPLHDRLLIGPLPAGAVAPARDCLGRAPGVSWFGVARRVSVRADAIWQAVDDFPLGGAASFRVLCRRSEKNFPLTSLDVQREAGRRIQARTGWRVDLRRPDLTVHLDITPYGAFVSSAREAGLGGLPVGTSGRVLALLSGGLDSPVAAFRMIRRGCRVVFAHFYHRGPAAPAVREKVVRLVEALSRFQGPSTLYLVPFCPLQSALARRVPAGMRMVAYRRAMLRVAEGLLRDERGGAIVTGDSLGQVASQTLQNLAASYGAARSPVLAPLIGEDKRSIIDAARGIGTYDVSIVPHDDCCQYLLDRNPNVRCRVEDLEAMEREAIPDGYWREARRHAERLRIRPPGFGPSASRDEPPAAAVEPGFVRS